MNKQPLYEIIYHHYKEEILSGSLVPGARLPSEKDIAKQFKVSRITVIRALNELESSNLIYRVQGSGSYVSENTGKKSESPELSKKSPLIISLVLPNFDSVAVNILKGVEDVARQKNYFVTYHRTSDDSKTETKVINEIISTGSHGIILYPTEKFENMALYSRLLINGYPLVLIDRKIPGLDLSLISINNEDAFHKITTHLIDLGHKRIIFVGSAVFSISSEYERYKGFCRAHIENGVPLLNKHLFSNADMETIPPNFKPYELKFRRECHYMFDLLEKLEPNERPTAIAAVNDYVAELIISVALERGHTVPGSFSITGFDNLPFASHLPVPLTTIEQPSYEIGRMAAIELLKKIKVPNSAQIMRKLEGKLILRESTRKLEP